MTTAARSTLATHYDALWTASAPQVRTGGASLDVSLGRGEPDPRRGLTLLARPSPATVDALDAFLDELRALEPEQHYQPRSDLHLTVLSLFTATTDHARYLRRVDEYREAVVEALDGAGPFAVDLTGVSLSPAAVIAQGFPLDDALERMRSRLRTVLGAHGFGADLDGRYRLTTAHATLVRFVRPLIDAPRFVDALGASRERAFGMARVTELELTVSDWYQTAAATEVVGRYALGDARNVGSSR